MASLSAPKARGKEFYGRVRAHHDECGDRGDRGPRARAEPRQASRSPIAPLAIGASILLVAAAALYWARSGPRIPGYLTQKITRGPIVRAVTTSGTVNPVITVQVGTYVSGVIVARYCDYNTEVKKGQICAKIDPRPYQVVVDQTRATLSVARAQLLKDKANLVYSQAAYDRKSAPAAEQEAISKDVSKPPRTPSIKRRRRSRWTRRRWPCRRPTARRRNNLGYTDIVSPVDGTVVTRASRMGRTVAASFQTPTLFLVEH